MLVHHRPVTPLVLQDTLPSPFPVASPSKYYYDYYSGLVTRCSRSDVYGTPLSTAVSIAFSNTVRAERSERPTPCDTNKCPATELNPPVGVHSHGVVAAAHTTLCAKGYYGQIPGV